MESYPYTNLQNVNLDWILEVVADFKSKYTDFGQAVTDSLQAIEDAKDDSLDALANALAASTTTINNAKMTAIQELNEEKASILDVMGQTLETAIHAVETAQEAAVADVGAEKDLGLTALRNQESLSIASINTAYNQSVIRLQNLIATFPLDDAQIIGQLQIINSILNGTDALSIQWQQGIYQAPYTWVNTPNTVSSVRQAGCAGRQLHIKANTPGHIIAYIYYWNETSPDAIQSNPIGTTETIFTFPNNAMYFSVLLGTNESMTEPINLADVTATANWIIAGFIQREEFEELKTNISLTNNYDKTLWEKGHILGSSGTNAPSSYNRIRTKTFLPDNFVAISVADGYKCWIYCYNQSGVFQGVWDGTSPVKSFAMNYAVQGTINLKEIGANYLYRLVVGDATTQIELSPENDGDKILFTSFTDTTLTRGGIAADAGAVGKAIASALHNELLLPSGDINDLTGNQCGLLISTNTYTHAPFTLGTVFNLVFSSTLSVQFGYQFGSGALYYRRKSTSWGDWVRLTLPNMDAYRTTGKYVAFGDSITLGTVWSPTEGTAYHQVQAEWRIPTRIALANGLQNNYVNAAIGGIGYFKVQDGQTLLSQIAGYDFTNVELVTIMAGANDHFYTDLGTANDADDAGTICGAIKNIIHTISAKNPKTQIIIIQPTPCGIDGTQYDVWSSKQGDGYVFRWSLNEFDEQVSQLCKNEHVGYLNWTDSVMCRNWKYAGYNGETGPNYTHPTTDFDYCLLGNFMAGKVATLYHGLN